MQKEADFSQYTVITPTSPVDVRHHGNRAKCLQRLVRLDLPVPLTVALDFGTMAAIAAGQLPDLDDLLAEFGAAPVLSARPSSEDPEWGGPRAVLNIGMNCATRDTLKDTIGSEAANALYLRFIQSYAVEVARLDPDAFEMPVEMTDAAVADLLAAYEDEADEPFPQDPARQLGDVLKSMARAWEGTTARLLRQARGAPADAGLGVVVQKMALGVGPGESGSGVIQFVSSTTGFPQVTGRYLGQSQGREALTGAEGTLFLVRDPRGPSLEEAAPVVFDELKAAGEVARARLREEMQIEFAIDGETLSILDAVPVERSARSAVRIAHDLVRDGVISREEALSRIAPRAVTELLHPQINPEAERDVAAQGIAASPGAAVGQIVFSAAAAQASAARGEPCILVRRETSPEDIRGMHVAAGVLTERGGTTSHAAVIARGLGVPCVVGASGLRLQKRKKMLTTDDGRMFGEGDVVTLDGSSGQVLAGTADMLQPALDDAFSSLMSWADEVRDIGVRANADSVAEAQNAAMFGAEGIGLCRTEHMFFEAGRLTVMHEMIFARDPEDRRAALDRLLPIQRADLERLFEAMRGLPVCIRLFDPPLHEFLPHTKEGTQELAAALDLPVSDVQRRIDGLTEFNPMLGMRGVRLGITVPEIYDMQARAIFEATVAVSASGQPVVPEIMIPLISAKREVELVKTRIDAVAAAVRTENGVDFDYRLGVMVETPRAALRAHEIAPHTAFMSFGTNDLTQMTYGLSRDDAGRFMGSYVQQGVYREDPFHTLDTDGVGELLRMGAERGREGRKDVVLSICGEHGGNPESIAFCRDAGFDYVSCSPFRVPVAKLAAAQLALNKDGQ
ncbi:MAG: putative PEP-binding protein [Pseudomonadota bacterium]